MFKWIFSCVIALMPYMQAQAMESILGSDTSYLNICEKAGKYSFYFHFFRSFSEYRTALEFDNGELFAEYILNSSNRLLGKIENFRSLDLLGHPVTQSYGSLGNFSATTLRYIVIADHINQLFNLPENPKIVEIGAGFGGQCFTLSQFIPFSKYYIYDLPVVSVLIGKVLNHLAVPNIEYMPLESALPEDHIDLLISNYAFSECSRETQLDYFERVIKKSDRGYMIYNQISQPHFGIDSLSPREFYQLLEKNNMNPTVYEELIPTHPDNILFIWEKRCL